MVFRGLNIGELFRAVTQTSHGQKAAGRHRVCSGTGTGADLRMNAEDRERQGRKVLCGS